MYLKIPSVYDPTMLPHYPIAKEMALIAVDEILNQFTWKPSTGMSFWEEVKKEIEKI